MTPAEYEWAQEQLEIAFEKRRISRTTFLKRMRALGLNARALADELEAARDRSTRTLSRKPQ